MSRVRAALALAGRARERAAPLLPRSSTISTSTTTTTPPISFTDQPWTWGDNQRYTSLDEHLGRLPLFDLIPSGRLIRTDPKKPYQVLTHSDNLLQSGLGIVQRCNTMGLSTEDLWIKENVKVLPRLSSFALKEVDTASVGCLTPARKKASFVSYLKFVKKLIEEAHGAEAVSMYPLDLKDIDALVADLEKDEGLADLIVNNPAFLPPRQKGMFYMTCYNLLVKTIPVLIKKKLQVLDFVPSKSYPTAKILHKDLCSGVAYTSSDQDNERWGTVIAKTNPFFLVWATNTAMSLDQLDALLTMLRVGVAHPLEDQMAKAIVDAVNAAAAGTGPPTTLGKKAPTFDEVILFFDFYFPRLAPSLARRFYDCGVYRWLPFTDLFPLRSVDST